MARSLFVESLMCARIDVQYARIPERRRFLLLTYKNTPPPPKKKQDKITVCSPKSNLEFVDRPTVHCDKVDVLMDNEQFLYSSIY